MSTSHDAGERRPAVWPWLLMPLVVLMVFYTLYSFRQVAEARSGGGGNEVHPSGSDSSVSTEQ